jgi:hypothetical protein
MTIVSKPALEHQCLTCNRTWISGETDPACSYCEAVDFTIEELKKKGLDISDYSMVEDGQLELKTPIGSVFLIVKNKSAYLIRTQFDSRWLTSYHRLMKWEVKKLVSRLNETSDKSVMIRKSPNIVQKYA